MGGDGNAIIWPPPAHMSASQRVAELVSITGMDVSAATALLEAAAGSVAMAVELYFDGASAAPPRVQPNHLERAVGQALGSQMPSLRDAAELRERMRDDRLAKTLRGEFCWSLNYDPSFFSELQYEGFLLICNVLRNGNEPIYVLMAKLHVERCILDWPNHHVSQKATKAAKKYELTISTAFDDVLQGCVDQHGEGWLYPPMRKSYSAMRSVPKAGDDPKVPIAISFELWLKETAEAPRRLVGGEFGTIVGKSYLSLSAFRKEDSAGSVQLFLTCEVLRLAGFEYWDLGQGPPHEYKFRMGGKLVPRLEFLERFRRIRNDPHNLAALVDKFGNKFTRDGLKAEAEAQEAASSGAAAKVSSSSSAVAGEASASKDEEEETEYSALMRQAMAMSLDKS